MLEDLLELLREDFNGFLLEDFTGFFALIAYDGVGAISAVDALRIKTTLIYLNITPPTMT